MTSCNEVWVWVKFLKPWGHPCKSLIMGTGHLATVSPWVAENLTKGGYVEVVPAPACTLCQGSGMYATMFRIYGRPPQALKVLCQKCLGTGEVPSV